MGNDEVTVLPPLSKMATAQVWPIVQSLAELVHHAPTVVDMLLALLDDPAVVAQVTEFDLSVSFRALCLRRVTEFGGGGVSVGPWQAILLCDWYLYTCPANCEA